MSDSAASLSDSYEKIEQLLGHRFENQDLLRLALTHTSARRQRLADYERLEFLGDRVLGLVIAESLLEKFPKDKEGDLAKRLAFLVRKETLAKVGSDMKLGQHIVLSKSEDQAGGRANPSLLADVCEALIAALYLDGGLEAARSFIAAKWVKYIARLAEPPRDPKTTLQEWAQGRGHPLPLYRILQQDGPSHKPTFTIELTVAEHPALQSVGRSKREAEQAAATAMLKVIQESKTRARKRQAAAQDG